MDKYEYKIRADEIKELIASGDFGQAADIADGIDWRRVKSVMMLCTVSDLYKINRRYEDAKNMLLIAYERRPGGRAICYSLCEICIKTGDYVDALNYYKEFTQVAPKDSSRYILQYKLYEAQEVSLEERIGVLEELKKRDYKEKWAYELARLYHRAGMATRCVEECDELILWFGEGKYVVKALELKMLHQPLTAAQQQMYEHRFDRRQPETEAAQAENYDEEAFYGQAENYGEEAFYGQAENYGGEAFYGQAENYGGDAAYGPAGDHGEGAVYSPAEGYGEEAAYDPAGNHIEEAVYDQTKGYGEEASYAQAEGYGEEASYAQAEGYGEETAYGQAESHDQEAGYGKTHSDKWKSDNEQGDMGGNRGADGKAMAEPELDIQVKTVDVGEYNTINLQAELAAGLQEVLGAENVGYAAADPESLQESGEELSLQEAEEDAEGTEVFFGETGELDKAQSDEKETPVETSATMSETSVQEGPPAAEPAGQASEEGVQGDADKERILSVQPPKELANMLLQEADGQIGIVLPENIDVEKQITGQMKIEDVLAEWERTKRENEEKNKEEVRRNVLRDTGNMFDDFETAAKEGLLEKLESDSLTRRDNVREEQFQSSEDVIDLSLEEPLAMEEELWEIAADELEGEAADDPEYMEAMGDVEEAEAAEAEELYSAQGHDAGEPAQEAQDFRGGQRPSIERDKEKIRGLTREEKELYASFIQSRHSREQLVKAIDSISMAAYTGNVVITGDEGMDTMTLAKNMIREVKMTDSNFSGKVAKITGQGFNKKDVRDVLEQLNNGALIIQDAAGMEARTAAALYKFLQQERLGIIVVMEDTKKAIQKLFLGTPELFGCFTARVDLEAFSNDTLVSFGRRYAREMEYSIDDLGVLALHTRIEELQTIDHVVTIIEVKKIVDEAIRHACRKTPGHFLDVLLARRYDDEDMIILTEKDFVA